jgi:hypothetical protein
VVVSDGCSNQAKNQMLARNPIATPVAKVICYPFRFALASLAAAQIKAAMILKKSQRGC